MTVATYETNLSGENLRIGIVQARFNEDVCHGLLSACLLGSTQGGQMCPSSSFLRSLNAGDDTPTDVYWTTIYSRRDGVVPNSSSRLDGGACHVFEDPGVPHNDMDNSEAIFAHVLDATNRTCDGTVKTT